MFSELNTPETWEYIEEDIHSTVSQYVGTFERQDGTKIHISRGVDTFSGCVGNSEDGTNEQNDITEKIGVTFDHPQSNIDNGKTLLIEYYLPDDQKSPAAKGFYNPAEATRIVRQVINNDDPHNLKEHIKKAGDNFTELDPIIEAMINNPYKSTQKADSETSTEGHDTRPKESIPEAIVPKSEPWSCTHQQKG